MSRAIVTLATGPHERLLDIAWPSFSEFAELHGYDLLECEPIDSPRPASWHKVPALKAALQAGYDEALWIDADCVIVDPAEDLNVPRWAWQALVEHHTGDGDVPNCGVWLVRQPMIRPLTEMWAMTEFVEHGWWEQAAMHRLLGYADHRPHGKTHLAAETDLYKCTYWLDNGWNVHKWDLPQPDRPRIQHASMYEDRAGMMHLWAGRTAGTIPADHPMYAA